MSPTATVALIRSPAVASCARGQPILGDRRELAGEAVRFQMTVKGRHHEHHTAITEAQIVRKVPEQSRTRNSAGEHQDVHPIQEILSPKP